MRGHDLSDHRTRGRPEWNEPAPDQLVAHRPAADDPTDTPPTSAPPGGSGCRVTSTISAWNNGLTNNVTITNAGPSPVTNWRLTFSLASGQTITSGWNATYSPTSGQVTATNAGYNSTIAPNTSTSIGYQATHTGNSAAPTGFALNGGPCGA